MALNPRISRYLAPSDSCISPFPGEDYYYPVSDSFFFFFSYQNERAADATAQWDPTRQPSKLFRLQGGTVPRPSAH